jgi:eukaryotic-like serine/threonine-protein kinase
MSAQGNFTQIGKYPVVRKLGEGATSEVYLCNDPFNLRDVAIKVAFPGSLADPARGKIYRKLFLTEAKLAGKLQHPHICQVYDAVAEENLHYLVMEYVDGGTLEKYCSPSSLLPVERIVEIIFKCTRALEFAHKLGVTHRDMKPANILHTGETEVKITDFGAALIATAGETTQVAGVGSPAYMSPEQVKDLPLDHRTDIYSVGVVMYHLLTGRLPFQAPNNYTLIYQITHAEAQAPSTFRAGIPEAVDSIVQRAMAKHLARRYANWGDFSADLAAAFRSEHFGARRSQEFADSDRFETLRRLPFFEHFSEAELWEVARISTWRHAPAGETLMKEGEPGDYFCILAQGEVNVTKHGRLLNVLRAGEPFGEMAYLSRKEQARGADVTVAADASIISIPTRRLDQASESCRHNFDRAFMEILVERLALANLRFSGV